MCGNTQAEFYKKTKIIFLCFPDNEHVQHTQIKNNLVDVLIFVHGVTGQVMGAIKKAGNLAFSVSGNHKYGIIGSDVIQIFKILNICTPPNFFQI